MMKYATEVNPLVPAVPVEQLVRSWVIVLPLLYFSNSGRLSLAETSSAAEFGMAHQIGLLVVCLICSAFILKRLSIVVTSALEAGLVLALPVVALLSCAWSVDPRQSLISALTLLCFTLFAFYLSETFRPSEQLDLVMITGAVAVPVSILLALLVPRVGVAGTAWRGIFAHKQQCGAVVTMFIITAVHWKPRTSIQRPLRAIYLVLCIVLLAMSQSRTGWLLAIIGLSLSLILWLLHKLARKDALFFSLAAIPCAAAGFYIFSLFAALILNGVGKDPTLSQRTIIWAAVWNAAALHPWLGYGYEAFWQGLAGASKDIVLIAGWDVSQAQSGYLDLWVQLGIVGIFCLLLLTIQALVNAVRSFRTTRHPRFVSWSIVVIVCNLIYNIGESDFVYLRLLWLLFLLACIGLQKEAFTPALSTGARTRGPVWSPTHHSLQFHPRSNN
jgi:O-antigen ligase